MCTYGYVLLYMDVYLRANFKFEVSSKILNSHNEPLKSPPRLGLIAKIIINSEVFMFLH